jgi:hypothetical protein
MPTDADLLLNKSRILIANCKATIARSKAACKRSRRLQTAQPASTQLKPFYEAAQRLPLNSTQLRIFLDVDSYEYFIEHLSTFSMSWRSINRASLLGSTRVVECDGIEAHELLLRARESCPGAIARISEAILTAGLSLN